jgi:hypothetical protein
MNRKIRYCNKKPINEVAFQALVKGRDAVVEDLAATIKTNEYQAMFTANAVNIEAKKKARRKRAEKYNENKRKSLANKQIATAAGRGYG